MGLWQKTMFYLGLVDEDAVGYEDDGYAAQPAPERRAPARQAPARQAPEARHQQPAPQRSPYEPPQQPARTQQPAGPMRSQSRPAPQAPAGDDLWGNEVQVRPQRAATPEPRSDGPQVFRPSYPTVAGRRVEPPMTGRRRPMADRALTEAGVVVQPADRPLVRTVSGADLESEVIVARSYNDAQVLADHIRANIPVVLDLRKVEPAMVRRLVDFSSGLTYALGGSMRKIGQGVVLVTPANVNLSRDERRRLKDLGYYQAPEEG